MSVSTKTTWDKLGFATDPNIQSVKQPWVQAAITSGKTTAAITEVDPFSSIKEWSDQATAYEWTAFITDLASKNGYTVTVTPV